MEDVETVFADLSTIAPTMQLSSLGLEEAFLERKQESEVRAASLFEHTDVWAARVSSIGIQDVYAKPGRFEARQLGGSDASRRPRPYRCTISYARCRETRFKCNERPALPRVPNREAIEKPVISRASYTVQNSPQCGPSNNES